MHRVLVSSLAILTVAACLAEVTEAQPPPSSRRRDLPAWIDATQTYGMVPVLPETAAKLHVSVNGVWAGVGGTDPVLSHSDIVPAIQARFGTDTPAFVAACRRAGLVVCGMVYGIEGMPALRTAMPDLDAMACRDAQGNPARAGSEMTLMCVNNPAWFRWEIAQGKRAIDLGAELVLLDTPMSASFVSGLLRGGFCTHCMDNFRRYLEAKFTRRQLRDQLGLTSFDEKAVIRRLSPQQGFGPRNDATQPIGRTDRLLFREFILCQEQASFRTRKVLLEALRAHAAATHRKVAFCTNASDLGTANPGGHWVRALMFADLVDLFAYELNPEPNGMMSNDVARCPRGKWAPYHRLAYSVHHRRAPAVIHAGGMGGLLMAAISQRKTMNTWLEVQSAEAYAANGAYIQYYVEPKSVGDILLTRCWAGSARHAAYVLSHRDLFDGEQRSGSLLAVLFLLNERGRTIPAVCPSYLGFAQALTEANCPFDVLFAGDGRYVRDRLTPAALTGYRALLVPSPIDPTPSQKRIVAGFVRSGGTLICQEPAMLGLPLAGAALTQARPSCVDRQFRCGKGRVIVLRGHVTASATGDIGESFLRSYDPAAQAAIAMLARSVGVDPLLPGQVDGLVSAFPVVQVAQKRLVVHLVNYDVDYAADTIRTKSDVSITVRRLGLPAGKLVARVCAPGEPVQLVPVRSSGSRLSLSLPRLAVSADVVISSP